MPELCSPRYLSHFRCRAALRAQQHLRSLLDFLIQKNLSNPGLLRLLTIAASQDRSCLNTMQILRNSLPLSGQKRECLFSLASYVKSCRQFLILVPAGVHRVQQHGIPMEQLGPFLPRQILSKSVRRLPCSAWPLGNATAKWRHPMATGTPWWLTTMRWHPTSESKETMMGSWRQCGLWRGPSTSLRLGSQRGEIAYPRRQGMERSCS